MSLGPMELAILLGIALLFFGPSRLPGLGRSLGDAIRGFKKGMEGEGEEQKSAHPHDQLKPGDPHGGVASDIATQEKKKDEV